jgi:hypothetical protein
VTHQAPLIPTRHAPDIWRKFRLDGGRINAAPWEDARARGEPVGTCRAPAGDKACGGYLTPEKPYQSGPIHWYPTRCGTCGNEAAARGPAPRKKGRQR